MSHTRGPWKAVEEEKVRYDSITGAKIIDRNTWIRFGDSPFDNIAILSNKVNSSDSALIAAAPEMLEFLESIIKENTGIVNTIDVKDLIKKAKGEL